MPNVCPTQPCVVRSNCFSAVANLKTTNVVQAVSPAEILDGVVKVRLVDLVAAVACNSGVFVTKRAGGRPMARPSAGLLQELNDLIRRFSPAVSNEEIAGVLIWQAMLMHLRSTHVEEASQRLRFQLETIEGVWGIRSAS